MTDFLEDIESCLETLKKGGIILYPTDTVWGLGCDATNEQAVENIYRLKQRPVNKSMIVLMADNREILKYITELDLLVFDYLDTVHKPTTVIYKGAIGIAANILSTEGTVGIRVTKDPFCRHLITRFRKPVVSTSANLSGQPTPQIFTDIPATIIEGADYVVKYRRDDHTIHEPSAVIKWSSTGAPEVIRP